MDTGDDPGTRVLDVTDLSKVRTHCLSKGGDEEVRGEEERRECMREEEDGDGRRRKERRGDVNISKLKGSSCRWST